MSYDMPILAAIEYKCPICGFYAQMDRFYGGPAYAHRWHYAIKCVGPMCPNHEVGMSDWKDSPSDAIRAWNRRCKEPDGGRDGAVGKDGGGMSDTDATQARQDVVADVDEILEHVINGNSLSMPYDVYVELFDAVDGLGVEIEKLQAENAKMKEELEAVGTAAYLYGRSDLKIENAKLRKLCIRFAEYVSQDRCEGCALKSRCNDGDVNECWQLAEIREAAKELGIEVS